MSRPPRDHPSRRVRPHSTITSVPDLRRLRYFLAVADELNFSRAAERLHVAQPALSRQIRALEQELGVDLLARTTHDVALTEAGRFLRDRGPALIASAEELWRSVRSFGSGEQGSVILGFGTSAGYETAPRLIEAIRDRLPGLNIASRVLPMLDILGGIIDATIDAGIVRTPPTGHALDSRLLRRERQGVLLRRDHPLAGSAELRLDQLHDEALLLHTRDANAGHYDAVLELYGRSGLSPRLLVRDLAADLTYAPIVDGRAVSITGESVAAALPETLRWIPLSPPEAFEIRLLARRHHRPPAVERLLESAVAAAEELGWLGPDAAAGQR